MGSMPYRCALFGRLHDIWRARDLCSAKPNPFLAGKSGPHPLPGASGHSGGHYGGTPMIERELQRKIEDFRELGLPPYVAREGELHLVDRVVSTVIGARRSGKSFRVPQAADELIAKGFISSLEQVCPVDFDNAIPSFPTIRTAHFPAIERFPECLLRSVADAGAGPGWLGKRPGLADGAPTCAPGRPTPRDSGGDPEGLMLRSVVW